MTIRIGRALPINSGGSGAAKTDITFQGYTAPGNGYGSYYHRYAADLDWTKPVGLWVHFHGDGGFEVENPTSAYGLAGPNGMIAQAKARNMVLLVPFTPDDAVGRKTWWAWYGKEENPRYAKDLIVAIMGAFNIDTRRIWFTGYSGGAQFITRYLIPHWGSTMGISGGGMVAIAGGQAPAATFEPFNPTFKAAFHTQWYVGEFDDGTGPGDGFNAIAAAEAGKTWYAGQGFGNEISYLTGKAHVLDGWFGLISGRAIDAHPPAADSYITPKELKSGANGIKEVRTMIGGVVKSIWSLRKLPEIIDTATWSASAGGSAGVIKIPALAQPGDLILCFHAPRLAASQDPTTPTGWTRLLIQTLGTSRLSVFAKVMEVGDGADVPVTINTVFTTGTSISVAIRRARSVTTPLDASVSAGTAVTSSGTSASINTTVLNTLVFRVFWTVNSQANNPSVTTFTGLSKLAQIGAGTSGNSVHMAITATEKPTIGATGTVAITNAPSSTSAAYATISIAPKV